MILMIAMVLVSGYISYIIHATGGSNYLFHSVFVSEKVMICVYLYIFLNPILEGNSFVFL